MRAHGSQVGTSCSQVGTKLGPSGSQLRAKREPKGSQVGVKWAQAKWEPSVFSHRYQKSIWPWGCIFLGFFD